VGLIITLRLIIFRLPKRTVLDTLREEGEDVELEAIRKEGFGSCLCVESGVPEPALDVRAAASLLPLICWKIWGPMMHQKNWTMYFTLN